MDKASSRRRRKMRVKLRKSFRPGECLKASLYFSVISAIVNGAFFNLGMEKVRRWRPAPFRDELISMPGRFVVVFLIIYSLQVLFGLGVFAKKKWFPK